MGGTLSATSEVGVGTTFTIILTTQVYDRKAELSKVSNQSLIKLLGKKVKVIAGKAEEETREIPSKVATEIKSKGDKVEKSGYYLRN